MIIRGGHQRPRAPRALRQPARGRSATSGCARLHHAARIDALIGTGVPVSHGVAIDRRGCQRRGRWPGRRRLGRRSKRGQRRQDIFDFGGACAAPPSQAAAPHPGRKRRPRSSGGLGFGAVGTSRRRRPDPLRALRGAAAGDKVATTPRSMSAPARPAASASTAGLRHSYPLLSCVRTGPRPTPWRRLRRARRSSAASRRTLGALASRHDPRPPRGGRTVDVVATYGGTALLGPSHRALRVGP